MDTTTILRVGVIQWSNGQFLGAPTLCERDVSSGDSGHSGHALIAASVDVGQHRVA